MTAWLVQVRKFLAAFTGAVAVAVSAGLLDGAAERWVSGGLAVVTAFVVYLVPNGTAPAAGPKTLADPAVPGDKP